MRSHPECMVNFATERTGPDKGCGTGPISTTTGSMASRRTNHSLQEHVFIAEPHRSQINSGKLKLRWSFPTKLFRESGTKGMKPIQRSKSTIFWGHKSHLHIVAIQLISKSFFFLSIPPIFFSVTFTTNELINNRKFSYY